MTTHFVLDTDPYSTTRNDQKDRLTRYYSTYYCQILIEPTFNNYHMVNSGCLIYIDDIFHVCCGKNRFDTKKKNI